LELELQYNMEQDAYMAGEDCLKITSQTTRNWNCHIMVF